MSAPRACHRPLLALAWTTVALHLVGLVALAWSIRPGSPLVELETRWAYLASRPWGWTAGWLVWMLCAPAFVAYLAALAGAIEEQTSVAGPYARRARLALLISTAAVPVDLLSDAIQIGLLPPLAAEGTGAAAAFWMADRLATLGGVVVANGLYSTAILLMTIALRSGNAGADLVLGLGLGVFGCGMLLSLGGLANLPWLEAIATSPTMLLYCAWVLLASRRLTGSGQAG